MDDEDHQLARSFRSLSEAERRWVRHKLCTPKLPIPLDRRNLNTNRQASRESRPLALLLSNGPESRYKRFVYENRWHYCETDPALTRPHFYICKLPRGKAFDTSSHASMIHFVTIRSPKDAVCCTFPAHKGLTVPVQLHRKNRAN